MKLTEKYIRKLFVKLKQKAEKALNKRQFNRCLCYLKAAAYTAYTFYLGFKDDELEKMLKQLSSHIRKREKKLETITNRCVFYDSFSLDNKGLTQQYIRAIMNARWKLLYLMEQNIDNPNARNIINEIRQYNNATIISIPNNLKSLERIQFIYDSIISFNPSKLFMHLSPSAVYAVTAFYALPESIKRYQINLTDHTFWIGTGCIDFSFEFRAYGAILSIFQRKISRENIFLLPYHPISKDSIFKGFPLNCNDKVVILSGGAYYKIVDEKKTFFKLLKIILDNNSQAVIVFVGAGDNLIFADFIKNNCYEDRIHLIGHRSDINEVFKHCDIYLNTYPFSGGLMCQYAANNAKPILSFCSNNKSMVEEFVCQKNFESISTFDLNSFANEAKKLIDDSKYRETKGRRMKDCILSENEFNKLFFKSIIENRNQVNFSEEEIMRDNDLLAKLEFENRTSNYKCSLLKILGYRSVLVIPEIFFDAILNLFYKKKFLKILYRYLYKVN